jgi:glycosyltransferase involved in cell wall biosynthesis
MHDWDDDRIFQRACIGLAREGHKVTLIAHFDGSSIVDGVNIVGIQKRKGVARRIFSSIEAVLIARKIDADIYHFHDPDLLPWMALLALSGREIVFDMHEFYEVRFYQWNLPNIFRPLIARIYRNFSNLMIHRFAGLVTVTDTMADLYRKTAKNIIVIPNTVDLVRLSNVDLTQPKKSRPVIIISGSHGSSRNCMQAVEALPKIVERIPDILLSFVGRYSPTGYDKMLRDKARELNVADNLEVSGMLPWEQNFSRIAQSHVACMFYEDNLNNRTTLPNRLFEYMFCGVPVLAEDFPEPRKIIQKYNCGLLVNSSEPESIAMGAIEILLNPNSAAVMGGNGRNAILEHLSFNVELKRMVEFYTTIS